MLDSAGTTAELVRRCLGGDRDASSALYHRYYERLRTHFRIDTRDDQRADELAHDALVEAIQSLKTYEPSRRFTRWLKGIAAHVAWDSLRKMRTPRRARLDVAVHVVDPKARRAESVVGAQDLARLLGAKLEKLRPFYREPLTLKYIEGLTLEAVAARLNTTLEAIRWRIERGLEALEKELAGHFTKFITRMERPELTQASLLRAVGRLRSNFREVVRMRHVEGVSREVISEQLNLSVETVDSRLQRGYELLKDEFGRTFPEAFSVLK